MYLRTLREKRKFTQEELERRSKVSQNAISRLERTVNARPSLRTVEALARALGCNPLTLEFGLDPNDAKPRVRRRGPRRVPPDAPPSTVRPTGERS